MEIRNRENLLVQAIWGGAFNAYVVFAIPYLIRLGASITLISIYVGLTSLGPLLIGPLVIIHLEGSKYKRKWLLIGGTLSRGSVLIAALAPLFGDKKAVFATIVFIVFAIPSIVFGALWVPIPGLTTDPAVQPKMMGDRIRLGNSGSMGANILFAFGMFFFSFPNNFTYIFSVCAIFGALEIFTISKIRVYDEALAERSAFLAKFKRQKLSKEPDYLIFISGVGLAIAAVSIAGPLQSVYFLKKLNFSDRWFSVWAILLNAGAIVGITFWNRAQKTVGSYIILSSTIVLASFYFLFIATLPNRYLLLGAVFYLGIMNSGTDLGIALVLYRLGNPARRDLLINIYVGVALGISFIAALFLGFFTDHFALTTIFLGSFAIRFVVSFFFRLPSMRARFADYPRTNVGQMTNGAHEN